MAYSRIAALTVLGSALALVTACGSSDDDTSGSGGAGGSTAGAGGAAGGTGGASGGSGGAAGGAAGAGGAAAGPAQTFCAEYETTCTFGGADRYADMAACVAAYDGYDAARQTCVEQHLGFAGGDATTHCPHAAGQAPCN